jgi:hypothetical protein
VADMATSTTTYRLSQHGSDSVGSETKASNKKYGHRSVVASIAPLQRRR